MHELSIAMNIVEICTEELQKAGANKVTGVEIEVGTMAGVETDALEFSWDVAISDSLLEGAPLLIRKIQAIAKCMDCGKEFIMDDAFNPCPACGNYGNDILKGRELKIKAITIE